MNGATKGKKTRGWIYLMTNRAMPGMVKIGTSGKDPFERTIELRGTHSPYDFEVEYDILVFDHYRTEKIIHNKLADFRIRGGGQGEEFFSCSIESAVSAIQEIVSGEGLLETFHRKTLRDWFDRSVEERKRAEAERAAQEEEAAKRAAAEEERLIAERAARERSAKALAEQADREAKKGRWIAEQRSMFGALCRDKNALAGAVRGLEAGVFAFCPACKRPNVGRKIDWTTRCEVCGFSLGFP